ncbi:albusnodin family lasso peptide [Salinactinospora qingdaonensis]
MDDIPDVIELDDAATLTRGGEEQSIEHKQSPYD